MRISKLQELLEKAKEEYGDVELVVNKYQYTKVTEVIPIFKQETLGITDPVVSKVEVY
jgi:hypothetical protein